MDFSQLSEENYDI
jgi:hypothetical protein